LKFGIPNMINTVTPPDVIQYTRQLVYKLLNSDNYISYKDSRGIT
jgi:hypothetical protein